MNERFVPVWVDIREQAFPALPVLWWDLLLFCDADGRVTHPYFLGYYVRSYVLSPDRSAILNDGYFASITLRGAPYLEMLDEALARLAAEGAPPRP